MIKPELKVNNGHSDIIHIVSQNSHPARIPVELRVIWCIPNCRRTQCKCPLTQYRTLPYVLQFQIHTGALRKCYTPKTSTEMERIYSVTKSILFWCLELIITFDSSRFLLTGTIIPKTNTTITHDTISAWFWIMNSWLNTGGFFVDFRPFTTILHKLTIARSEKWREDNPR